MLHSAEIAKLEQTTIYMASKNTNWQELKECLNAVNRWFVEDSPEPTEAHPQRRPFVLSSFILSIIVRFCLSSNGNDMDPLMEEPPVTGFTHRPTGEAQTA